MATKRKKKNAASALKSIIIVAIMAGLIILAYYRVANVQKEVKEEDAVVSAVQEILLRDMTRDYPPSPKEVIKYYSDLTKCYYNVECTDSEIEELAKRSFLLFDDELVEHQEWNRYITDLKSEIATKKSQDYAIMSYSVSASTDVTYFTKDQYECASLYCTYNIRNGAKPGSVQEQFILRRDENGHWRILGWVIPEDDADDVALGTIYE